MSRDRRLDDGSHEREIASEDSLPRAAPRATEVTAGVEAPAAVARGLTGLPERYEDLRLLGSGGFGEVRRVFDRKLGRVVAMKTLLAAPGAASAIEARFLSEIELTASLSHPGIVAIHDAGELADGRLWYTMPEVRGRTLRALFDEAGAWPTGPARRRLLEAFARVCEAVGYAHSRGVIHRDLKPENIMVGEFGQVLVMDWGLARRAFDPEPEAGRALASKGPTDPRDPALTRLGDVLGTPAYMPPEQALGQVDRHGPAADVYSLGAILYHLLAGEPPSTGSLERSRHSLLTADPPRLSDAAGALVPEDLVSICERAMARDPASRYGDAAHLGADVRAFLDGARKRERALAALEKAELARPDLDRKKREAESLRARARRLFADLSPSDPAPMKWPAWQLEDDAERADQDRALLEARWLEGVHGALTIEPDLPEAHAALAAHYGEKLLEAERDLRPADAARFEELLRAHDRGDRAALLAGKGTLTLVTDPPGARVILYRYALSRRRLVPEGAVDLGATPLFDVPLDRGSYLLRLEHPGRATVSYPVLVERVARWDGCPPGSATPHPIALPLASDIDDDEVYVPAGWAWTGGDPYAVESLPRRRAWIDGFIAGRFPVTNEQYLTFLNDLILRGREDLALLACPRANPGTEAHADRVLSYDRGSDGLFRLKTRDPGEEWRPRGPAALMSWRGAMAYAAWRAETTGRPYRLLHELEREKAARGVDGRRFPWGNHFDPTWARISTSTKQAASRVDVDDYPEDESPYGLRHGAGNTRDFCLDLWTPEGPDLPDGRLRIERPSLEGDAYRSVRGGAWSSVENHCRAAGRFANRPDERRSAIGLRVCRSFPGT